MACVGRRINPTPIYEMCVRKRLAPSLGSRDPRLPSSFKFRACIAIESERFRGALGGDYKNGLDLRMAGIRRALLHVKRHLPPANSSGLEVDLGRGSEVPSGGTLFSLMAAQACGSGSRAGRVARGSIDRIRLNRAPHMKFMDLLGTQVLGVRRALEYFRRVAKGTDRVPVRASSKGR